MLHHRQQQYLLPRRSWFLKCSTDFGLHVIIFHGSHFLYLLNLNIEAVEGKLSGTCGCVGRFHATFPVVSFSTLHLAELQATTLRAGPDGNMERVMTTTSIGHDHLVYLSI